MGGISPDDEISFGFHYRVPALLDGGVGGVGGGLVCDSGVTYAKQQHTAFISDLADRGTPLQLRTKSITVRPRGGMYIEGLRRDEGDQGDHGGESG